MSHTVMSSLKHTWDQIWFQDRPTTQLELIRIGISFAMLCHYGLASAYIFEIWGNQGWFPPELIAGLPTGGSFFKPLLYYITQPWQLIAIHIVFLFSCAALMVGWRTSWVKWLALIGHLSYAQRSPEVTYGVDAILSSLLLLLCLAPIGRAISLDRARAVRQARQTDPNAHLPVFTSRWGFACRRLMQLQMAVLFFYSGIHKTAEPEWWHGDAIWHVFALREYYSATLLDLFAAHFWLVNIATYGTIIIEVAYPFLIWQRGTRRWLLAGAVFLHLLFFFFLGLYYFSWVMMMGHVSFVRTEWLDKLAAWWKTRTDTSTESA